MQKNRYHWSFGDTKQLRERLFTTGFSASKSTLPSDKFDPNANWENRYDVVYTGPEGFKDFAKIFYGSLCIRVKQSASERQVYVTSVRQMGQNFAHERAITKTHYRCNTDAFWSLHPGSWEVRTQLQNVKKVEAAPFRNYRFKGSLKAGCVYKKYQNGQAKMYRNLETQMPIVPSWSLLAAVQTFPSNFSSKFHYFEELERIMPFHTIQSIGTFTASFGGQKVKLNGFSQKGTGLIPSFYWVDQNGRLLIVRYGLYLLVFNDKPIIDAQAATTWESDTV